MEHMYWVSAVNGQTALTCTHAAFTSSIERTHVVAFHLLAAALFDGQRIDGADCIELVNML